MPMWRRRMRASSSSVLPVISSPARTIAPSSAVSRPATRLSRVDLPQPDGPITAANSPARSVRSQPRRARTGRVLGLVGLAHRPHDQHVVSHRRYPPRLSALDGLHIPHRRRAGGRARRAGHPRRQWCQHPASRPAGGSTIQPVTGGRPALHERSASSGEPPDRAGVESRSHGRLADHGASRRAGEVLEALGEVHGVADDACTRAAPPSRAGRPRPVPVDRPMPSSNGGEAGVAHSGVRPRPGRRASPAAAARARSAWSACGNGAPNTAITASPTNCMTVPPSPRMASFIAARCSLSWRASAVGVGPLGDARVAADVGHQHGDVDLLGLADPPALACAASRPGRRAAAATASRPAPRGRRSPGAACAGGAARWRSPVDAPWASLRNSFSTSSATASGVVACAGGDGLDRPALGDLLEQLLVGGVRVAVGADRLHERVDDGRVEGGAAGGHRPDGVDELVALGDPVLQQVAVAGRALDEQGDGVLGVVELARG